LLQKNRKKTYFFVKPFIPVFNAIIGFTMKKIFGMILGLLLVGVVVAGIWIQQNNSKNTDGVLSQDSPVDISKLCVSVSCGDHYGCGTIYDDDSSSFTIVTAMHVLQDYYDGSSKDISVTFEGQEICNASVLKDDTAKDVVFLSVERDEVDGEYDSVLSSSVSAHGSSGADGVLSPGQTIYFVDANTGDIYAGSIASPSVYSEDFGMDMIYCYCAVTPGMSGTGLFDESGHYLGILLGGSDEAEAVCLGAASIDEMYNGIDGVN
jgi:S1-C subfamily serine protease